MAKPLLVQTDRSPARKIPLSEGGGLPVVCSTAGQALIHVVPEGYRDELYIWANNNDSTNDGEILIEFDGDNTLSIVGTTTHREIDPIIIDGMVLEARTADVEIECLAIAEPVVLWGCVLRTAIES